MFLENKTSELAFEKRVAFRLIVEKITGSTYLRLLSRKARQEEISQLDHSPKKPELLEEIMDINTTTTGNPHKGWTQFSWACVYAKPNK